MKLTSTTGALLFSLVLVGCAGTSVQGGGSYKPTPGQKFVFNISDNARMSPEGQGIFETRLANQLSGSGQLASRTDKSARTIEVVVENYYMRHGAARALVGVMAGADNMRSSVIVKEAGTGTEVGRFRIESTNPTAMGTSRGMIEDHADKIVIYLQSGQ